MIYLDYSANTPVDPAVLQCFVETEQQFIGNANSNHAAGFAAKEKMAQTTSSIASLLGVLPSEIIYTSGASESNNTAIKGLTRAARHIGKHIISTPLEHSSVSGCLTALQEQGYEIDLVDIDRTGKVDVEHFRELLRDDTVLAAITAVDSELGTVQPIAEIIDILKDFPNCRLHVDATQAIGKTKFSFADIDTVSLAPHKFYGLNGSGILYKRQKLIMEPLIHGGASTTLYRSGTPALSLAVCADKALQLTYAQFADRLRIVQQHNDTLRTFFAKFPKVRINSPADAVPHILNLSVQGIKGTAFQKALDAKGVCVSVKSACSTDGTPSRAVFAVSQDRKNALSSWRISLSHLTTEQELSEFMKRFEECYQEFSL